MKKFNEMYVIGIDHGYGNMKTANCCFPTGMMKSDTEPTFVSDLLVWNGKYYSIGVGHKEFTADKFTDEDYYVLTLAAIARELRRERITNANVFIAAGLPLTWVSEQKADFKKYLLANNKLIEAAFEKNVLGTLRDDLFERMTANYEQEQRELIQSVADLEQRLANAEQDNIDLRAFLSIIRKCTDLKELTPELVNRLITKIEVFDSTKDENGKKHVPIKVHFIGVGVIVIPDGKTILETYEEIRKNPPRVA